MRPTAAREDAATRTIAPAAPPATGSVKRAAAIVYAYDHGLVTPRYPT
ncbi:MAG TPA: hypothetical protein VE400_19305 [Mycobacterium sp.]|nr:hypothetical protein [Mycobacterium sp.]